MWHDGEGKPVFRRGLAGFWADFPDFPRAGAGTRAAPRCWTERSARNATLASGLQDRGVLEMGRVYRRLDRATPCGAFEQHATLEGGRAHHWIALENPLTHRREIRSHQADRFQKTREQARLGDGFV